MSASPPTLLTAAFVAPMWPAPAPPLLRDAGVVFDEGRILAVGPAKQLARDYPDAIRHDAGNATILPGLVNAHTHLELSDVPRGTPPTGGFAAWLLERVRYAAAPQSPAEQQAAVAHAVATGIAQCLRFGVTTVGDISRFPALTRPLLAASPLNVVSFGEVTAMATRRDQLEPRLAQAIDPAAANAHLHVGISPHAPYSIEAPGYARCLQTAVARNLPLTTHLAESADEAEFLAHHTGPLRELWNTLGWDDHAPPPLFPGSPNESPVAFAHSLGLLAYPRTLLAHVNYCSDADLALLAAGKASVVFCPRTHAFFGHPPHRWREMLAAGINVCVGTDSAASSLDLNPLDELRLLHHLAPELPAESLWPLITTHAAAALGLRDACGSLTPNSRADFAIFTSDSTNTLADLLTSEATLQTWLGGRPTFTINPGGGAK